MAKRKAASASLDLIRRTAIIAMASDEALVERLVLKGGNALDLAHGLSGRGSLDIDFSIEDDFEDLEDIQSRIFRALHDRFDSIGLHVFDERFRPRPTERQPGQNARWGGYRIEFKLIDKELAKSLAQQPEDMRRRASVVGLLQEKVFRIDISKYEYCAAKTEYEFDHYMILVYPPPMIAVEKLRAVCQQMPEYPPVRNKRARARDFFDVHTIVTKAGVDLTTPENLKLFRDVFAAKDVPLSLLSQVVRHREFHRADWPAVVSSSAIEPEGDFDYYFDFALRIIERLESLWHE
jgi:predicted nucleotidyltransferase component of viral defense system